MDTDTKRRALGLIRVSRVGDRKGDRFVSPKDQEAKIIAFCAEHDIELLGIVKELDVSGGAPMAERYGLNGILLDIEARARCGANSLVVGYFDRLARSTEVGQEVMRRLGVAGGHLYVAEEGEQLINTPDAWFIFTVKMATAELFRRQAGEKTHAAKKDAIARGVPTFANIPPGYLRADDRTLVPDPVLAPVIRRAFELRDEGASWNTIRAHLREHGIVRCLRGTVKLFKSRIVLGELNFGELVNLNAHEPIVDYALWSRVQRRQKIRGRYTIEPRLLARLNLLKCGTCGSAMHVGGQWQDGRQYRDYRCPGRSSGAQCKRAMSMRAETLEAIVKERICADLDTRSGSLEAEQQVADYEVLLRAAEAERDNLIVILSAVAHVEVAQARIAEAQAKVAELIVQRDLARQDADPIFHVYASRDWDELTFEEQRRLLCASFRSIEIVPGRGRERVKFQPTGKQTLVV